jgi:hypothetical protein
MATGGRALALFDVLSNAARLISLGAGGLADAVGIYVATSSAAPAPARRRRLALPARSGS